MSNLQPPENWRDIVPRQPWATHLGELEAVSVPNPVAGAEFVYSPAGGAWERVELVKLTLVVANAGAARNHALTVQDGNNRELGRFQVSNSIAVNSTVSLTYARLYPTFGSLSNAVLSSGLPELILRPGWRLVTITTNMNAADQYSAAMVTVTRYSDADPTLLEQLSRRRRRSR